MSYCDTHAHLSDRAFVDDRVAVAREALSGGLRFIVDVGTNPGTWEASAALARDVPGVWRTVGLHPHDAKALPVGDLPAALDRAWDERTVAVGEVGLDFHYDFSPRPDQRAAFAAQLEYARRRGVPVVVHVREAMPEALELLRAAGDLPGGGVVHCFSGSWDDARALLDLGLHLSFTGVLAFPRSADLRDVVRRAPLDRIFFETDCPYLAPPPHRGRRNHPAFVRRVVEVAAEARSMGVEELAAATTATAALFFRLPEVAS